MQFLDDTNARKKTKRRLLRALEELLKEKGLGSITVSEVCDRADVSRQAFYLHFHGIDDLVLWAKFDLDWNTLYKVGDDYTWDEAVVKTLEGQKERAWFYTEAYKARGYNSLAERELELVKAYYSELYQRFAGRDFNNEEQRQVSFYAFGAVNITRDWARNNFQDDPVDIMHSFYKMLPDFLRDALPLSEEILAFEG